VKPLLLISLLAFNLQAAEIFKSDALVVVEHQMGSYFSHPIVREAANDTKFGITTVYIDPAKSNTRTERSRTLNFIREKIRQYEPKTLYLDSAFLDVLNFIKYKGKVVSVSQAQAPERNSEKIASFVEAGGLPKNFYLLHDNNAISKIAAFEYKSRLAEKFDPKNIHIITINSFQDIRIWLHADRPDGILLNFMSLLFDREISKFKFSVDIKKELTENNSKFLDIGFTDSDYNESLVLVPDYSILYRKTFREEDLTVNSKLLANQKRLQALGKFNYLAEAFKQIDGLTE